MIEVHYCNAITGEPYIEWVPDGDVPDFLNELRHEGFMILDTVRGFPMNSIINLRSYDMIGTLFWVNRQSHPIEHTAQPESSRRMEEALKMMVDPYFNHDWLQVPV